MEAKREYFVALEDGTQVPVTAEVYAEYYRPEWREHKLEQRDRKRLLSMEYEYGTDEGAPKTMADFRADMNPGPEETYLDKEELVILSQALEVLAEDSRKLINALYIEEKTERQYAEETGIARTTINYQRKKAIQQMKDYMEKNL